MRPGTGLLLTLATMACGGAQAQTVATGAGRGDELAQGAAIDAYLNEAARTPAAPSLQGRVTPAEAAASAGAVPMDGAYGLSGAPGRMGPASDALALSRDDGEAPRCDHKLHGEVGAEIGTGGTRGGYGVVTAPVGKDCWGQITVGVSSYHGRGYGYGGYGGGPGWGYGPAYGYGARNRTSDSFSFGFSAGQPARAPRDDDPGS